MPIYEYQCNRCQVAFELLVMGSTKPACPICHRSDIEKLLSVPAAPSVKSGNLPVAPTGQGCGLPRCCGGGCQ